MYVSINDVVLSSEDYYIDSRTLIFNTAPANGAIIRIYRETTSQRLVSWADASVLKAADMTISQVQQNHLIEEAQDWSRINSVVLEDTEDDEPKWNMQYHRVVNVATPVENGDAVTKGYMESVQGGFVQENTALKNEATKQATNASASASAAKTSETNAKSSETSASNDATLAKKWAEATGSPDGVTGSKSSKTWAGEAANSASAAKTSETNAKSSETKAANSASSASSSASTATTKATAASNSASAAKTSETNAKNSETSAASSASAASASASTAKTEADRATYSPLADIIGKTPNHFKRPSLFTTNKTTITIPKNTQVNIGDKGYISTADVTLQLSNVGAASTRAGKDVYVYACQPSTGTVPVFVLSLNSTVPSGYNANNSRKIGGFHCLCVDVGSISGHKASGYVAGDIIPISAWDLLHRADANNEGMVYIGEIRKWIDIYLSGVESGVLVSKYGATIADGSSSTKYNGELFVEKLALVKKRPLWRNEFMVVAKGSNEGTNITGSTDPGTTGGHKDTAGRRMISNYFLEDCCGALHQWLADTFEFYPGASWSTANFYLSGYSWQEKSVYNPDIDTMKYGSCNGLLRRGLAGGDWDGGSHCGSRCVDCVCFSSDGWSANGCRGACEPRVVNL